MRERCKNEVVGTLSWKSQDIILGSEKGSWTTFGCASLICEEYSVCASEGSLEHLGQRHYLLTCRSFLHEEKLWGGNQCHSRSGNMAHTG